MSERPGAILITGCSSGIGHATALRLARAGHTVYATARTSKGLSDLAAAGATTLDLDVTDEASRVAAVQTVEAAHGAVGVLVNNAGYGEYGPIEEVPIDRVRRQFETNVFGAVRMVQLVLPRMREAGRGRIVNVSSMGGRLTMPFGGCYHATKYAVESLSDALRMEVGPLGIRVILVEPGPINSGFNAVLERDLTSAPQAAGDPYAALRRGMIKTTSRPMPRSLAGTPEDVAKAIDRAVTADRPKTRYVVTATARVLIFLHTILPDRAFDALSRRLVEGM